MNPAFGGKSTLPDRRRGLVQSPFRNAAAGQPAGCHPLSPETSPANRPLYIYLSEKKERKEREAGLLQAEGDKGDVVARRLM
jgi:hypothetical protein